MSPECEGHPSAQHYGLLAVDNIDLARAKSEALVNNTCEQNINKSCNAKRGRQ